MNWAVIMAGGRGTRFWPESRNATPKQFLALFGSKTLLEQTADRLSGIVTRDRIVVVTQQSKTALVKRLLKIPSSQVIGEPVGRNTAPCMILAAEQILRKDPDAVISLLPSDHHIANPGIFKQQQRFLAAMPTLSDQIVASLKYELLIDIQGASPRDGNML